MKFLLQRTKMGYSPPPDPCSPSSYPEHRNNRCFERVWHFATGEPRHECSCGFGFDTWYTAYEKSKDLPVPDTLDGARRRGLGARERPVVSSTAGLAAGAGNRALQTPGEFDTLTIKTSCPEIDECLTNPCLQSYEKEDPSQCVSKTFQPGTGSGTICLTGSVTLASTGNVCANIEWYIELFLGVHFADNLA
jgi:hypothetical protein